MTKRGKFITFESQDGGGTTTQIDLLAQRFRDEGHEIYATKEPTDFPTGKHIRKILSGKIKVHPRTLAPLFISDRLDHIVYEEIEARMNQGETIFSDRYDFSTYAFQMREYGLPTLIALHKLIMGEKYLIPDVTILFTLPVEESLRRVDTRGRREILEEKSIQEEVAANYLALVEINPDKRTIITVNGSQPIETITNQLYNQIKPLL